MDISLSLYPFTYLFSLYIVHCSNLRLCKDNINEKLKRKIYIFRQKTVKTRKTIQVKEV